MSGASPMQGGGAAWRRGVGPPASQRGCVVLHPPPGQEAQQVWVNGQGSIEAAFERVYRWLRPRFLTWAVERVGPGDDLEDALHDAMVRLWERRTEVPSHAWIRWAWRAAERMVRRRRATRRVVELGDGDADMVSWMADHGRSLQESDVPVLPGQRERLLFWLTHCLGLSSGEVARVMGMSASAVRTSIWRAMQVDGRGERRRRAGDRQS